MKVGFISLGCSKNLVDTEMCIGLFKEHQYEIINKPSQAEILVINTCGFIEAAKQEAINTILEMTQYKQKGRCKYLIVMGCLVQRYKKELKSTIPEVDLFLSLDEYDDLWEKITQLVEGKKQTDTLAYKNRIITTGKTTAYLKIAEGCSNYCTYCAIPKIRGPFVSRKMEDILEEANLLAQKGIREIIVIAQDTTKYGIDIYGESKLAELLNSLSKIKKFHWIRFLYAYPESITDKLIETVKQNSNIVPYFDIPIQHISDSVLKRMNRKTCRKDILNMIQNIREKIPNVILRTSLIVGFPGETKEEFLELCEFVKNAKFDKLGVFQYSKEDGTPAAKLKEQIHWKTKQARWNTIMQIQQEVSKNKLQEKIGNSYEALIEQITPDKQYAIARTYMDVPDMDGVLWLPNHDNLQEGQFVKVIITEVAAYDLKGNVV